MKLHRRTDVVYNLRRRICDSIFDICKDHGLAEQLATELVVSRATIASIIAS